MSLGTVVGNWVWQRWVSKALVTALKAGLAGLITWLASRGVPSAMLDQIAQSVDVEVIAAGAGAAFFFVLDLVQSVLKHR